MQNALFEFATPILSNFIAPQRIIGCHSQTERLSPQPLHCGGYKQTAGLLLPDPTLIPAPNRQQGWQSQTKRLSPPTTTPQWLLADGRVGSLPDQTLIPPILADARVGCVPDQMLIPLILADARVGSVPDPM